MNQHKTTIHIRCPFAPVWDYYTVVVFTKELLKCERLQELCDDIRGKEITQEAAWQYLRDNLPHHCDITVKGRHGANGRLVIRG
jgi:hypothetical protein